MPEFSRKFHIATEILFRILYPELYSYRNPRILYRNLSISQNSHRICPVRNHHYSPLEKWLITLTAGFFGNELKRSVLAAQIFTGAVDPDIGGLDFALRHWQAHVLVQQGLIDVGIGGFLEGPRHPGR